jgi:hypothetical protein
VLVLLVAVLVWLLRARRALAQARAASETLAARLDEVEQRLAAPAPASPQAPTASAPADREYLITHLGEDQQTGPDAPVVPAPVFADLVLRESVVQAALLAAGLRRALSPETRHRIRFEMRRELKRARKQRRSDLRAARRQLHDRERAAA